jgi:acetylornithine/succinyldiaminopimelate/putrescine aminotransferase
MIIPFSLVCVSSVNDVGIHLIKEIHDLKNEELKGHIDEVRWPGGLMMGIDIVPPVREVIEKCAKEGLLIIRYTLFSFLVLFTLTYSHSC